MIATHERPAEPSPQPEPPPLRQGDHLRCPFCGHARREWDFPRLRTPPQYRRELWPILRCPQCGKHFAPVGAEE